MRVVIEHKAASVSGIGGGVVDGADPYTFTVIASVTGVLDDVGDIIEPGAYSDTLRKRPRPKVIKDHDWARRLGKVLSIAELRPGDQRLPKTTPQGQPWPVAAGALVAKVRLFQGTVVGEVAAAGWAAEGPDQQFSIGYSVPAKGSVKGTGEVKRRLRSLDLFEISDVLWGAMPLAGPMPAALATKMLPAVLSGKDAADPEDYPSPAGDEPAADDPYSAPGDWPEGHTDEGASEPPGDDTGTSPGGAEAAPAKEPGDGTDAEPAADDHEAVAAMHAAAEPGMDWNAVDAAAADAPPMDQPVDEAKIAVAPDWSPEIKRSVSAAQRRAFAKDGVALPDGSYFIETPADLSNAVQAYGRANAGDRAKVRRHIMKRARALGRTDMIPDAWKTQGKAGAPGVADTPGDAAAVERLKGWYVAGGGAAKIRWGTHGDFMRCVHIAAKHMDPERAKGFCNLRHQDATGGPPGHGLTEKALRDSLGLADDVLDLDGFGYSPSLETGPDAGHKAVPGPREGKGYPRMPGSYEERRDAIDQAVSEALRGDSVGDDPGRYQWYVCLDGTWDDHVIATRSKYDPSDIRESYEIAYMVDDDQVVLGTPRPVQLTVLAIPDSPNEAVDLSDVVPLADGLNDLTYAAKVLIRGQVEGKAGRVLSAVNATRIRGALQSLVEVLAAAGVSLDDGPTGPEAAPVEGKAGPVTLDGLPDPRVLAAALRASAGV